MNIIGIELEYISTFHILPHAYISLGKSIWFRFSCLNLQLTIKHISLDYKAKSIYFSTPSVTIMQYPSSAYLFTFEIDAFRYLYRKGFIRDKSKEVDPCDNTPGFVHESWLRQFQDSTYFDFMSDFDEMINKLKDYFEHKNNED